MLNDDDHVIERRCGDKNLCFSVELLHMTSQTGLFRKSTRLIIGGKFSVSPCLTR